MPQSETYETGHNSIYVKGSKQDVANKPRTQPMSFVFTGAGCEKASACALFKAGLCTPGCSWGIAEREANWPSTREKIPRKGSKCTHCSQRLWGLHMGNSSIRCHALMHNLTSWKLNEHIWIQKTSVLKESWLIFVFECPNHPSGCSVYNDLIFISLDKQRKLRNCVTAHEFSSTDAGSHHRHRTCWNRTQSSSLHSVLTVETRWVLVCLAISNEVMQAWRTLPDSPDPWRWVEAVASFLFSWNVWLSWPCLLIELSLLLLLPKIYQAAKYRRKGWFSACDLGVQPITVEQAWW